MKNNIYDIVYKEYINSSFHEAKVINYKFNKDYFIIRLQTTNSFNHFNIDSGDKRIEIKDYDKESVIFDLVLKNPKIKFNKFVSCMDDTFAEISNISPIKNDNKIVGFEIFINDGSLPDDIEINEMNYSWFRIICSDFFYHIIGHITGIKTSYASKRLSNKKLEMKLDKYAKDEREFITKHYLDIVY